LLSLEPKEGFMNEQAAKNKPLGLIELPDKTFEHDLAVSDRFQSFSAELLRLALLGIAAIGFLVTNIIFKDAARPSASTVPPRPLPSEFKVYLSVSLVCLGLSAAFALVHRYIGSDSVAYHLAYLRRGIRQAADDSKRAEEERQGRDWRFRWSGRLLFISGLLLWLGAISLAASFIVAI
jgi:hypothetical protein